LDKRAATRKGENKLGEGKAEKEMQSREKIGLQSTAGGEFVHFPSAAGGFACGGGRVIELPSPELRCFREQLSRFRGFSPRIIAASAKRYEAAGRTGKNQKKGTLPGKKKEIFEMEVVSG